MPDNASAEADACPFSCAVVKRASEVVLWIERTKAFAELTAIERWEISQNYKAKVQQCPADAECVVKVVRSAVIRFRVLLLHSQSQE